MVRRVGSTVVRPAGPHTATVHRLLAHLRTSGFERSPAAISIDRAPGIDVSEDLSVDAVIGTETVSYLPGEVTNYPVAEAFRTDRALVDAAELLRSLHDATVDFVHLSGDRWFIPPATPVEVICHGDFAPYNCVVVDGRVVGVFDFETAHPGPRVWDVGYAAYRWVPLADPAASSGDPESLGDLPEQRRRLALFCQAYGMEDVASVVSAAANRLTALVETMRRLAEGGNEAFAGHIADGHDQLYLRHIAYLRNNVGPLSSQ